MLWIFINLASFFVQKMKKQNVVIGFLGTQLDSGKGAGRWEKWRPTLSLVQHDDVVIARMELFYTPSHRELAERVRTDIRRPRPKPQWRWCRSTLPTPGTSARSMPSSSTGRRATLSTPSARSIDAHHHGHARGADLPFPAGGVATHSGRARADVAPKAPAGGRSRQLRADRSGPVTLRRYRPALRRRATRCGGFPQERHRHAQCPFQRADRRGGAGGGAIARAHPLHRADRRGQVASGAAHV